MKKTGIRAVESPVIDLQEMLSELENLQELAPEGVTVYVDEDFLYTDTYSIDVNGQPYSNDCKKEEVETVLQAIKTGMEMAIKLQVHTTAGIITAHKCTDPGVPGVCLMLQPAGVDYEIDLAEALVYEDEKCTTNEKERPVDVVLHVWADPSTEERTAKHILRRENIV